MIVFRVLAPLVRRTTYRRGVHLLLGAVIALPYVVLGNAFWQMLTDARATRPVVVLALVAATVIGAVPAFLGGTRALEIVAARSLLDVDLPDPTTGMRPDLEARVRCALWFVLHLVAGAIIVALLLIAVPVALLAMSQQFGLVPGGPPVLPAEPSTGRDAWTSLLGGGVLLAGTGYLVAGSGALAALMAPVLLGPSSSEREHALEARSRRLAERNRLARELHDSVGHAMTVTTLQAAAARERFDSDPDFARRALSAIEETGRTAMEELDYVLSVLHERDRVLDVPQPQRTLADLDQLRDDACAGGMTVDLKVGGPLATVPAVVSRAGYRIVQEGLTNAARHAGAVPVTLRVTVTGDALAIDIDNPVPGDATPSPRGGRGLDGMDERVRLLGGRLDAGRRDGLWRVAVHLPLGKPASGR